MVEEHFYPRIVLQRRDALSEDRDFYRGYIKGYEEGLNQAWDELIGLTTRGYSPREIQVVAKSKRQSVTRIIKDKKESIKKETGVDLTDRTRSPGVQVNVEAGNAYIVEINSVARALDILNALTEDGTKSMCILRSFPGNFADEMNAGATSYWLTKHENGGQLRSFPTFSPSDMGRIVTETRNFMKEGEGRVVLLEGIEYLIVQNDLNGVLKFLQTMVDQTVMTKSVLLLAVYPAAIEDRVLSNLKCNIGAVL
jgi:hypothetical protein